MGWHQVVGLALQLLGTAIAGWVLWEDFRAHGRGPLIPAVAAAATWLGRHVLRRPAQQAHGVAIVGTTATGTLSARGGYVDVPDDAPVAEQLRFLRERLAELRTDLTEVRQQAGWATEELERRMGQTAEELRGRVTHLQDQLSEAVAGRARAELFGLLLVGVGSVISTV